jgi:chromosome condensin MukBEF ATPase and DNA-binding subunit MukB
MTVITRLTPKRHGPEESGPELYAPPDRRGREKPVDVDQAAVNEFESEMREFLRRDLSLLNQQLSEAGPATGPTAESLDALIRRVGGASIEEIDRVIHELQEVRNQLCNERERLSHEIARYTSLSHLSMTAMKSISDSLKQSKGVPDKA